MAKKTLLFILLFAILISSSMSFPVASISDNSGNNTEDDTVVLRISNCEEYIDEGGWDREEDIIDLDSGDIFSDNSMIEEFEKWYKKTYGKNIVVEYSTFGTNEDLYNQLTLGDSFDLVCPSDYMGMKMIDEKMLQPLSDDFFDKDNEYNYYIKGISPYIKNLMDTTTINGERWSKYSAGYMWGTMGFVYNPDVVSREDASTWKLLENKKYSRQITIKDSVRDTYFGVLGLLNSEKMLTEEFKNSKDYNKKITALMNDTSQSTINKAEEKLKNIRENVYSFETDSGKSDMVSGKVVANFQWSGDGVYTLDQAEEDDCYYEYAVPDECSNLWCDGWVMLKKGVGGNKEKQQAAEAFINYISRADNVIRNMYYVGYTSCISGGNDGRIFEYLNWCYSAEDGEEGVDYPLGFFFSGNNDDEKYIVHTTEEQTKRQLFAQYPTQDVLDRCAVMMFFDEDANARMNQMWINVRCFNLSTIPASFWFLIIAFIVVILLIIFIKFKNNIFKIRKPKGFKKVN